MLSWRRVLASILSGGILCAALWLPALGAERRRIVVLPFRNLSQQPADNWLSESFSESLIMGLGQSRALRLIERSEIQAVLKEQALMQSVLADPSQAPQLGQLMGAEYMIVGNFQRVADQVQAHVRLVNVSTGEIEGSSLTQVQGNFSHLFTLQAELAQKLLQRLNHQATSAELQQLQHAIAATSSTQAHEYYIRGLSLLSPLNTDQELQTILVFFQQAIAEDPAYALAHAGLAEVYARRALNPLSYPSAQADDSQRAMASARKALSLQPQSAEASLALSYAYQAQREPQQALQAAEQAVQQDREARYVRQYLLLKYADQIVRPEAFYEMEQDLQRLGVDSHDPLVLELLAAAYLGVIFKHPERDHQALMLRLETALTKNPRLVSLGIYLALMHQVLGHRLEFNRVMAQVEQHNQDNPLALFILSIALSNMRTETESALRVLNRIVVLQPDFAPAYQVRASVYHKQMQDLDRARADLQRSLVLAPDNLDVLDVAAQFYLEIAEPTQAETLLKKAQHLNQSGSQRQTLAADLDFYLGQAYRQQGKLSQALQQYQAAIAHPALQQDHRLPRYLRERAHLLAEQQQFAEALADMTRVLELNPDWPQAQWEYKAYYLQQQLQSAPQDPRLHNDLGQAYLQLGVAEQALKHLQIAHQLEPDHAVMAYNLGLAYQTLGQLTQARQAFEKALVSDPDYAKAHLSLAQLELEANQLAQAETRLQALLQREPEYVKALEVLASLRQRQGQSAQAQTLWQRVLALDPQHFKAREQLEQLRQENRP